MVKIDPFASKLLLLSLAAVLTLSSVSDAVAQKSTTSVSGHVYDQSGAVLPGATVRLTQPGGFSREVMADAGGAYRFDTLLIGAYELSASGSTACIRTPTISATSSSPIDGTPRRSCSGRSATGRT